ncbi:MAG: hypothetical protein K0S55_1030 [Clostridia bacterium]|nr:hypothetical protein [Clostridia bacterium]
MKIFKKHLSKSLLLSLFLSLSLVMSLMPVMFSAVNKKPPSAILNVIKVVINDDDGTLAAADFDIHVKKAGVDVLSSPSPGEGAPGTRYVLEPGVYTISEDVIVGYTAEFSGDINRNSRVRLAAGDNKTVIITNNDIPTFIPSNAAALYIITNVINDDDGTLIPSDFYIHLKNSSGAEVARSPQAGEDEPGTIYILDPGTYTLSADVFEGYDSAVEGDIDNNGVITLLPGDDKKVTIIFNDTPVNPDTKDCDNQLPYYIAAMLSGGLFFTLIILKIKSIRQIESSGQTN